MEDVLSVYTRPYDPRFPQVCIDESAKHLLQDKRESLPMQKSLPERVDYTFESEGMRKIFLACEPLTGQQQVKVTEHRTSQDWAHFIRELVDVHYPNAEKIVLVMDNLNTHTHRLVFHLRPIGRAPSLTEVGNPLHARTWELAEYGRD